MRQLAFTLAVILIVAALVTPVAAQDPVVNAAATIQAATIQAQQRQQAATATRQAQIIVATRQAQDVMATQSAQVVIATQSAQAEIDNQRAIAATSAAQSQAATRQALDADATRQALDADATRAAYNVKLSEMQRRSDFGTWILYLAGILALVAIGLFLFFWVRSAARRVTMAAPTHSAPAAATPSEGEIVIDVTPFPQPALPGPVNRMAGSVGVIDNPQVVKAFKEYLDKNAERHDPCSNK
jgi:hypothetical protein